MQVLRLSFLSGAVLDLAATIGTALVAVTVGVRLIAGELTLRAGLVVLLLTPELYAPLRALGTLFHASTRRRGRRRSASSTCSAPSRRPRRARVFRAAGSGSHWPASRWSTPTAAGAGAARGRPGAAPRRGGRR